MNLTTSLEISLLQPSSAQDVVDCFLDLSESSVGFWFTPLQSSMPSREAQHKIR
jgi:hypothetical protein